MAITGKFVADFADFDRAVKGAEIELKSFEGNANKVAGSLARMTDQFSGRKLIQDATLMVEAVERIGGVSKLTETEVRRLETTVGAASEKLKAMGMAVPASMAKVTAEAEKMAPSLTTVATTATTSTNAFGTFDKGLSQADKTLAAFGVNIGSEIQAVRELGAVSGKTAGEVGAIGTAGLAVSAALAGWQVGRWIADWLGLDEAIGKATASLLGWGDVAAQTAGAKADTIAAAIKRGADATISYTEAIKYNEEWFRKHSDAMDTSRHRVSLWQAEISKLGNLEAFRKELDSGNSSLKQLSTEYGISVEAIQYFVRETKKATDADKERTTTAVEGARQRAAAEAEYAKVMRDVANETGLAQMKAEKAAMDHAKASADANAEGLRLMQLDLITFEEETAAAAAKARQIEYDAWFKSVNEGVLVVGQAITQVDAAVAGSLQRTQAAVESTVSSWSQAMQQVQGGRGTLTGTIQGGGRIQATATREQIQKSWEIGRYSGPITPSGEIDWSRIDFLAGGGPVAAGGSYMVGERGPELFSPKSAGTILPNRALGGSVTINMSGVLLSSDPSAKEQLRQVVGEALVSGLQRSRRLTF